MFNKDSAKLVKLTSMELILVENIQKEIEKIAKERIEKKRNLSSTNINQKS